MEILPVDTGCFFPWLTEIIPFDRPPPRDMEIIGKKIVTATITRAACLVACLGIAIPTARASVPATLDIEVGQPGPAVPPSFYGLMTEEINHSYDGGLFAELIQNRTFQDPGLGKDNLPIHWSLVGSGKLSLDHDRPVNDALPVSLRLDLAGGTAGVANDGYWGIPIRPATTYTASFYARGNDGFTGPVNASLLTDEGDASVAAAKTPPVTGAWRKYTVTLQTAPDAPTTAKARFVLSATGAGSVSFSLVSLFPPTYQDTPGGLRPDLMKLLASLHPAFIRLPGGNYLEGNNFADRFNWKQMIGPADQRPGHMGCWSYRSSDGFGLPQFLLWCQQLGAEPVLAVFAGYTLNHQHVDAGSPELAQYTEEALQEIEYVSGPADSEWGKRRAADGFPKPFALHYVEIGNEDWFDRSGSYDGRFTQIAQAIRARYPQLKIIATAPVKTFPPDLYDDHYYRSASQMMKLSRQYDKRPAAAASPRQPEGMQTFVGEWATQEGRPTPDLNAALADAAFLMGLEHDADAVPLECYAPLLVNVNPADPAKGYPKAWQWPTNLIGYDALHSFGSPSYYAQAMFAQNKGDRVLPSKFDVAPAVASPEPNPHGLAGVGTYHTGVEYKDIVVTAPDGKTLLTADLTGDTRSWHFTGGNWNVQNQTIKPGTADSESWATTGDPGWTDYTIHLRARKVGGKEGFLVLWHAQDGENYDWWNIGGWNNTHTSCEETAAGNRKAFGPEAKFTVETGRWYDLRLQVAGNHVRGFIDDKLVTDATVEPPAREVSALASALSATAGHVVIVKVVNAGKEPLDTAINLHGIGHVEPTGTAIVLAGEPQAMNTVDQPTNVAPREEAITNISESFRRTFPPHSLTLLRLSVLPK
jgi:alpha-L-arabinofuranosidase